jgi:hypothetical protein
MTVSFKSDVLPLFTRIDIEHMTEKEVPLDDYSFMSLPANASRVYTAVSSNPDLLQARAFHGRDQRASARQSAISTPRA